MDKAEALRWGGHTQQWGGTRLVEMADGLERGVRAVEFRTTTGLEFDVLVDRGMDVAAARYRGRSLVWHSQAGFAAPAFREFQDIGWMRMFGGGLFATAGLDHIFLGEQDPHDTYGYPSRGAAGGMAYDLHGRVSTIPAVLRSYGEKWEDGECILFAEGEVRQAGALAESLILRRRVETTLEGSTISWTDTVENEGAHTTPHMMLYHINFGAPLLGPASRIVIPSRSVRWTTPNVEGRPERHQRFTAPSPDGVEEVFEHDMVADEDGRVELALLNEVDPDQPWGVTLSYDRPRFPYFLQWSVLADGTYAMGFEPTTNPPGNRASARESGELLMLEPGQVVSSRTSVTVLDGREQCERAERRIAARLAG